MAHRGFRAHARGLRAAPIFPIVPIVGVPVRRRHLSRSFGARVEQVQERDVVRGHAHRAHLSANLHRGLEVARGGARLQQRVERPRVERDVAFAHPLQRGGGRGHVARLGVRGEQRHERVKVRFHAALHHVAHHLLHANHRALEFGVVMRGGSARRRRRAPVRVVKVEETIRVLVVRHFARRRSVRIGTRIVGRVPDVRAEPRTGVALAFGVLVALERRAQGSIGRLGSEQRVEDVQIRLDADGGGAFHELANAIRIADDGIGAAHRRRRVANVLRPRHFGGERRRLADARVEFVERGVGEPSRVGGGGASVASRVAHGGANVRADDGPVGVSTSDVSSSSAARGVSRTDEVRGDARVRLDASKVEFRGSGFGQTGEGVVRPHRLHRRRGSDLALHQEERLEGTLGRGRLHRAHLRPGFVEDALVGEDRRAEEHLVEEPRGFASCEIGRLRLEEHVEPIRASAEVARAVTREDDLAVGVHARGVPDREHRLEGLDGGVGVARARGKLDEELVREDALIVGVQLCHVVERRERGRVVALVDGGFHAVGEVSTGGLAGLVVVLAGGGGARVRRRGVRVADERGARDAARRGGEEGRGHEGARGDGPRSRGRDGGGVPSQARGRGARRDAARVRTARPRPLEPVEDRAAQSRRPVAGDPPGNHRAATRRDPPPEDAGRDASFPSRTARVHDPSRARGGKCERPRTSTGGSWSRMTKLRVDGSMP